MKKTNHLYGMSKSNIKCISISQKTQMIYKYGLTNGVLSLMPQNVKASESTDLHNTLKDNMHVLEQVNTPKCLVVMITANFYWSSHINSIVITVNICLDLSKETLNIAHNNSAS